MISPDHDLAAGVECLKNVRASRATSGDRPTVAQGRQIGPRALPQICCQHVLVPDGLWHPDGSFVSLPQPEPLDVERILRRLVKRLAKELAGEEAEVGWPSDALEALQRDGVQHRLALGPWGDEERQKRRSRLAVVEGSRLHADTRVHANDRAGLERLCRYGSRGPIAEERLSLRDDGRYAYSTKRGSTLVLTAVELLNRLVALVPPARRHLTTFHGAFAPNSSLRRLVMLSVQPEGASEPMAPSTASALPSPAPVSESLQRVESPLRPPRLDWATLQRRTFGDDVWQCPCGGRRKVLAVISHHDADGYLRRLGLLIPRQPVPLAQAPPQLPLPL